VRRPHPEKATFRREPGAEALVQFHCPLHRSVLNAGIVERWLR
jgi:hypothetical protein